MTYIIELCLVKLPFRILIICIGVSYLRVFEILKCFTQTF